MPAPAAPARLIQALEDIFTMRESVQILYFVAVISLSLAALASNENSSPPEDQLYTVYSKDVGWDRIDLVIMEVERGERISLFHVPNYTERTAMESRFAMCAFSQAAMLRGFSHWLSARPAPDPDHVYVGFYSEYLESPEDLFDESFLSPEGKKMPGASMFAGMCQFFDPYSGESSNKSLNQDVSKAGTG